jgi:prevent-host-death family protein
MSYSVKEAKDNLSEIIRLAESGSPQVIKRHETDVAVVVSISDWRRAKGKRPSLVSVLRNSPLVGVELDLTRQQDRPRDIELGA